MIWAQSTTKNNIGVEHKLHSISKLVISRVIIPQVTFLEPIYIPWALNTGKNSEKVLEKNTGEWTGRVEMSTEEISGSKRSMYGYKLTYSRL